MSITLLIPVLSPAQNPPPLSTDRPSASDASTLVPPGLFQVETGYQFTHDDTATAEQSTHTLGITFFRYGLLEPLELRFGVAGYNWQNTRPGPDSNGLADGTLDAKLGLLEESSWQPRVALRAGSSIPLGEGGFSSQRFDPFFRFLVSKTITPKLSLLSNLGAIWETTSNNGQKNTNGRFGYTALAGYTPTSRLSLFIEFFGSTPFDQGQTQHSFDTGLAYLLSPVIQIDMFVGAGLTASADDVFTGFGISYRWPN